MRRHTAATMAGAAGAAWTVPALAALVPSLCPPLGIERKLGHAGGVALTFDDGPHPEGTPAVLEALDRTGARATFFLVGEQIRRDPGLAGEIVARGHTVALHGDRHRTLVRLTPGALRADLDRGADAIAQVTGAAPERYRPPYGVFSAAGIAEMRRRGWRAALWSRWGEDWKAGATAETVAAKVTTGLEDRDVVLLHDADHYSVPGSWRATVAALPLILDAIERRALSIVPL